MKKSVLIVDDDLEDTELILLALEGTSGDRSRFMHFCDPKDAISHLCVASTLPDAIIIDLRMPGMDGLECFKKIHHVSSQHEIPVIVYSSAEPAPRTLEVITELGGTFHLKPFSLDALRNELHTLLENLISARNSPGHSE